MHNNVPNDQYCAEGILSDLGVHELEGQVDIRGLLVLNPFVKVAGGEDNVVEQPSTFADLGFETGLVQVLGAGLDDLLHIVLDTIGVSRILQSLLGVHSRPVELAQLHEAELDIASLVLLERLAGGGDARGDFLQRGIL